MTFIFLKNIDQLSCRPNHWFGEVWWFRLHIVISQKRPHLTLHKEGGSWDDLLKLGWGGWAFILSTDQGDMRKSMTFRKAAFCTRGRFPERYDSYGYQSRSTSAKSPSILKVEQGGALQLHYINNASWRITEAISCLLYKFKIKVILHVIWGTCIGNSSVRWALNSHYWLHLGMVVNGIRDRYLKVCLY